MNARRKLNAGHVYGSIVISALIGWLTESFSVFCLTSVLLICGAMYSGDIRVQGSPDARSPKSRKH